MNDPSSLERSEADAATRAIDYHDVFHAAPDGIVLVDHRGIIVDANPRALDQFGYSREGLVGQLIETLVPEGRRHAHVSKRTGFRKDSGARPMGLGMVLSGQRRDGSQFPVEISLSPTTASGRDLVIAVVRDVTERSQLRAFGHGALKAAEEERKLISGALHDHRAQLLATLLIRVKLADGEQDSGRLEEMLEELRTGLRDASESVRRIARGLRPPALEDAGVIAALQSHIRDLFDRRSMTANFDGASVDPFLDADRKLVLYRVVQEALSNVVRHSNATTVVVEVKMEGSSVIALVEDDGSGFDEGRIDGGGLGLVGMRERAVGAGGRVSVESELGRGTRVRLTIPVVMDGEVEHG